MHLEIRPGYAFRTLLPTERSSETFEIGDKALRQWILRKNRAKISSLLFRFIKIPQTKRMNWSKKVFALCCFALLWTCLSAGSGGPDPYGYIWKDSNEPGVTFQWVDIVGRAGSVQVPSLADDNAVGPFNVGWNFHYYWSDYNSVKIGSNGWISFSNVGNIASCFPLVPTAGGVGDNILAPLMSDLTFISNDAQNPNPGELWYWTNNVDSFVVQWKNVPWWKNAVPDWIGSNSFELILSGRDSSITFQYQQTDSANFPGGVNCPTFMEIGIENVTGNLGLNYSTGTTVPPSNYVVKFIYPSGAAFLVPDATPSWNMDPDNAAQFVKLWTPTVLTTNVTNVGNTPITSTITARGRLRDLQLQDIWQDSASVTGLNNGADAMLSFGNAVLLTRLGQYYYDVSTETAGGQDINPTNNDNSIEIVSISSIGGQIDLSYASGLPPSESVSWAGGSPNDGVAVKMVPPDFPAMIDSVRVYIIGDGDLQTPPPVGFAIKIFGLDGNGQPNPSNLLGSVIVNASDVVEDGWNTVALPSAVTVGSGGFAVAWMQLGSGISLGAERYGPISRRSYEILGGSWAPYRSRETVEFLIEVSTNLPVGISDATFSKPVLAVFPNPIGQDATLHFELARTGEVDLELSDLQGQSQWKAHLTSVAPGAHDIRMQLDDLAGGLYFLRMTHLGATHTIKVLRGID